MGGDGTCAKGITCLPRCPAQHAIDSMQLKKGCASCRLEGYPDLYSILGSIYTHFKKVECGGRCSSSSVHINDENYHSAMRWVALGGGGSHAFRGERWE